MYNTLIKIRDYLVNTDDVKQALDKLDKYEDTFDSNIEAYERAVSKIRDKYPLYNLYSLIELELKYYSNTRAVNREVLGFLAEPQVQEILRKIEPSNKCLIENEWLTLAQENGKIIL